MDAMHIGEQFVVADNATDCLCSFQAAALGLR